MEMTNIEFVHTCAIHLWYTIVRCRAGIHQAGRVWVERLPWASKCGRRGAYHAIRRCLLSLVRQRIDLRYFSFRCDKSKGLLGTRNLILLYVFETYSETSQKKPAAPESDWGKSIKPNRPSYSDASKGCLLVRLVLFFFTHIHTKFIELIRKHIVGIRENWRRGRGWPRWRYGRLLRDGADTGNPCRAVDAVRPRPYF